VIAVPNDRLLALAPRGATLLDAFRMGYDLLRQTVENMVELNTQPGLINRDFSYVRAILQGSGCARMGTAVASGEDAVLEAVRQAINCPLLEDAGIAGARSVLLNVTASSQLGLHALNEACALIREAAGDEAVELSFGLVLNESMGDSVKATLIAAGFPRREAAPAPPAEVAPSPPPDEELPPEPPPPVLEPPEPLEEIDIPAYLRQGKVL
jgi:cell division protein FtsZ